MCNRYETPDELAVQRHWQVERPGQLASWSRGVFPRSPGPFIRRARDAAGYERELVVGQWGLIPWFAKEPKLRFPTNNARAEELARKASYKEPWKRGQRCQATRQTGSSPIDVALLSSDDRTSGRWKGQGVLNATVSAGRPRAAMV